MSDELPTLQKDFAKLNSSDAILDWSALRRDVETHNPELAYELTQRVTDAPDTHHAPEKDVPDWHADLFHGFDKKQNAKQNFSDLFYGMDMDLSKQADPHGLQRGIGDEKEIEFD